MADRLFNQFQGTLEKGVVTLFAKIEFAGGTDNPDNTDKGPGIASCTYHSATGLWLLTLKDRYQKLLGFQGVMYKHDAVPTAIAFSLGHIDVNAATPTLDFYTLSVDGNGAEEGINPGDGEVAYLTIVLSNSSAL